MSGWETIVGLEIHAHLKTRTKMFCRCEAGFGAEPNTRTCPVCLAHPGTLPVPNRRAVEWTIKLGVALDCEIADHAVFARKNYFYPDLPKGYQISQYDEPLCLNGRFDVPGEDGDLSIGIVRAHLEEDAAKTVHLEGAGGRIVGATRSLVDFNRGGTPLVEIVTQPDLRSADEARRFLQLLRQTIVELGISDAEMEKGTLRCDANVSVRRAGEEGFRTRWELKNMNSFSFIARGIDAAVREQIALHEAGEEVAQETYDYDPDHDTLTPHRSKEEAEDYRYFPEPDLVPVEPPAELVGRLREELPELPGARIARHSRVLGAADAWTLVTTEREAAFDGLVAAGLEPRAAHNHVMNRAIPEGANLEELARVLSEPGLTADALQAATAASATSGFSAGEYLAQKTVSDTSELEPLVDRILAENPGQVAAYRGGKEGLLGFFVGQAMKETQGKADPKVLNELIREKLKA
ncbi:MAG TPA: Asp-tRNA(Asn)/Glu-tRNA(Gln) amidotransferase subunit GatB [Gaiellaceae bacterium]|nr:Asp-tRNA(Asn)/Glu-tRNA(Gln) amidotransferase subunit GatB [Gaiellaceae bacterium]